METGGLLAYPGIVRLSEPKAPGEPGTPNPDGDWSQSLTVLVALFVRWLLPRLTNVNGSYPELMGDKKCEESSVEWVKVEGAGRCCEGGPSGPKCPEMDRQQGRS